MKLTIVLLALLGLAAASYVPAKETKYADKAFLEKQKFLFEIVYRVEDPLMFEEYIKFGKKFVVDKSKYTTFDYYMEKFYEAYKLGALLPKGEFFGALAKTHYTQAFGLFNFFYYAKDFESFMQNVCWARIHVNEGMFVYALTLAVIHRDDFNGLIMPAIYEIFPQFFFNSKFVYEAEKFDYSVYSKYVQYEKEYKDILYKDFSHYKDDYKYNSYYYFYTKDWKTYQWWKMMGLGDHWYAEEKFMLRETTKDYINDPKFFNVYEGIKMFYMPVDYTRDIAFYNDHSKMSYFTEDLGWNAYWYYFNMDYAFFLDGKTFGLNKDRRGEYWVYTVQQILARYYAERLSNGFGDIPEFSFFHSIEYGYDPELIYYNGVGYSYRKNYYEVQNFGNYDMFNQFYSFYKHLYSIVEQGYYKTADGTYIDFRKPESIEYIGSLLQGNIDTYDKNFFTYWYLFYHMYFGHADFYDFEIQPNVMLNFETMMRDPLFYMFYKKITDIFYHFKYFLQPYTNEELYFPGITFKDVKISELTTFFDLVDFDVTNLMNDKMTFVDGKFEWDKALLARQQRLNHKDFDFEFSIDAEKPQKVVIRTFYAPKFDEFGKTISLSENRYNFIEIDEFVYSLKAGSNVFKRYSKDFYWTAKDRTTYTELYKYVMLAFEGKYEFPYSISEPHCSFPDRLLLPHGWAKGYPVQFFFYVTPFTADYEQFATYDYNYSCGVGSGVRHIDNKPFGYPFDRPIDEYQFFVPNMYFEDAKIYHEDKFEKYYEKKYEFFGKFDYFYY